VKGVSFKNSAASTVVSTRLFSIISLRLAFRLP
jgi:hypothetical protein